MDKTETDILPLLYCTFLAEELSHNVLELDNAEAKKLQWRFSVVKLSKEIYTEK